MAGRQDCSKCSYFHRGADMDLDDEYDGFCRRYAPKPEALRIEQFRKGPSFVSWPVVYETDWCGEFA